MLSSEEVCWNVSFLATCSVPCGCYAINLVSLKRSSLSFVYIDLLPVQQRVVGSLDLRLVFRCSGMLGLALVAWCAQVTLLL